MRKPRPLVYSLAEVTITKDKTSAHVQYKDPQFGETTLTIGAEVAQMTDQEIIDLYNETLEAQAELASVKYVAIEPPLGSAQIEYSKQCDQWTPRGHVLRCLIDDTEGKREPVIMVDSQELSWREFGKLICTFAGWGMRIEFTPQEETHRRPRREAREPED